SESARQFGIRPDMTLTQARALCAGVEHAEHDPRRDARALEALGRWMTRFTPAVALAYDSAETPGTVGLFPHVTGGEHLFGGIDGLVAQVRVALAHLRLDARVAAAPTPGAAWALAF